MDERQPAGRRRRQRGEREEVHPARSGDVFPIGGSRVDCSVTDSGGLTTSASFTVAVTLAVDPNCGFLAPLRPVAPYSAHALNSTVPHKVCAPAYRDGTPAADLASGLHFVLLRHPHGSAADAETVTIEAAGSTAWRWDDAAGHYIFNLKTSRSWSRGDSTSCSTSNDAPGPPCGRGTFTAKALAWVRHHHEGRVS